MIKQGFTWTAAALFTLSVAMVGCEEKPGEFREVPEDGPPPVVDMPDPVALMASTSVPDRSMSAALKTSCAGLQLIGAAIALGTTERHERPVMRAAHCLRMASRGMGDGRSCSADRPFTRRP